MGAYDGTYLQQEASKRSTEEVYKRASASATEDGDSGELSVGHLSEIAVDIDITAVTGTTPTADFTVQRKGADGVWYTIYSFAQQNAVGKISRSIGPGCETGASLGDVIKLAWDLGGTSPDFTFSASIKGK